MKQTYSVFDFARGACIAFLLAPSATSAQAPVVFADESTCPADLIRVPDDLIPYLEMDATRMPINLEADSIDLPSSDELELRGNAFVTQGARAIYADEILFNKKTMSLQAQNATLFSEQGDLITAAELDLEIETRIGSASMVTLQLSRRDAIPKRKVQDFSSMTYDRSGFTVAAAGAVGSVKGPRMTTALPNEIRLSSGEALSLSSTEEVSLDDTPTEAPEVRAKARATAERLFLEGHDRERLQDVVYTRCVAGDDSVLVEAKEITLDHASGVGVGEHLKVRFYGVPIAYAPKMSFPINEERKSGLLFPTVGFGDNWGLILRCPITGISAPPGTPRSRRDTWPNEDFLGRESSATWEKLDSAITTACYAESGCRMTLSITTVGRVSVTVTDKILSTGVLVCPLMPT